MFELNLKGFGGDHQGRGIFSVLKKVPLELGPRGNGRELNGKAPQDQIKRALSAEVTNLSFICKWGGIRDLKMVQICVFIEITLVTS